MPDIKPLPLSATDHLVPVISWLLSNPVFTSLLAWIFLKERCTILDCVFTVFTLTGVILIARPPFIFGEHLLGIEGNYSNHIKGTIAAFAGNESFSYPNSGSRDWVFRNVQVVAFTFAPPSDLFPGAIAAAFTLVVLRKIGKSAHYYLSVWYYAVIGFIECIITVSVLGEWKLPSCGRDRWILVLIAVLGIAGQTFLTKALQIEKAGPVALMRTVDVVLAFIFQFIFFSRAPTWWSLGGALCIVASTSGIALRKWYNHSHKTWEGQRTQKTSVLSFILFFSLPDVTDLLCVYVLFTHRPPAFSSACNQYWRVDESVWVLDFWVRLFLFL